MNETATYCGSLIKCKNIINNKKNVTEENISHKNIICISVWIAKYYDIRYTDKDGKGKCAERYIRL